MTNRHIEDEGTPGEEIARITTRDVRWRKSGFTDGDKVCPAEERFETELALAALLANHVIVLNSHQWMKEWPEDAQKTTALSVSCNDIFAWACFDAEDIMIDELQSLYHLWIKDRSSGSAMWCAIKRNQLPHATVEQEIRKAGIWDLDALYLGQSWTDAETSRLSCAIGG